MKTKERKWHILFFIIILLQIFPLVYMLSISLKSMDQVFSEPLKLIPSVITFENYKQEERSNNQIYMEYFLYFCNGHFWKNNYKHYGSLCNDIQGL